MAKVSKLKKKCRYIEEMNIGDYIPCGFYQDTYNSIGNFFDLGTCDYPEIITEPTTDKTLPMIGRFNFIKVDESVLIADRGISRYFTVDNCVGNNDYEYYKSNCANSYIEIRHKSLVPMGVNANEFQGHKFTTSGGSNPYIYFSKTLKLNENSDNPYFVIQPNKKSGFICVEFPEKTYVQSFRIGGTGYQYSDVTHGLKGYLIEGSYDGINWFDIAKGENNFKENKAFAVNLETSVNYKFYKLNGLRRGTNMEDTEYVYIDTFELYDRPYDCKKYKFGFITNINNNHDKNGFQNPNNIIEVPYPPDCDYLKYMDHTSPIWNCENVFEASPIYGFDTPAYIYNAGSTDRAVSNINHISGYYKDQLMIFKATQVSEYYSNGMYKLRPKIILKHPYQTEYDSLYYSNKNKNYYNYEM